METLVVILLAIVMFAWVVGTVGGLVLIPISFLVSFGYRGKGSSFHEVIRNISILATISAGSGLILLIFFNGQGEPGEHFRAWMVVTAIAVSAIAWAKDYLLDNEK